MKCLNMHRKIMFAHPTYCESGGQFTKNMLSINWMKFADCSGESSLPTLTAHGIAVNLQKVLARKWMKCPYLHMKVMFANPPTLMGMWVNLKNKILFLGNELNVQICEHYFYLQIWIFH